MAIKVVNLFGELALESTLRQVLRAVQYARDSSDRMRVIVDSGFLAIYNGNTSTPYGAGVTPLPFAANSWNITDAREVARQQSEIAFMQSRNRWKIS